ncbi:Signal peptide peptidase [Musa troglodytarum]|uniref:Signal peptide peptidase n=1 Tax=Musa troglodytarum TaxID=320322 RepID=A0A9E7JGL4_9LILI|nr:Signal peptide peptidase [Musa troglodytarum]
MYRPYRADQPGAEMNEDSEKETVEIKAVGAISFVIVASAFLVLLFFFMSYSFVLLLIVLFCIAGSQISFSIIVLYFLPYFSFMSMLLTANEEAGGYIFNDNSVASAPITKYKVNRSVTEKKEEGEEKRKPRDLAWRRSLGDVTRRSDFFSSVEETD